MQQDGEMLPFRVGCFRGGGEAGGKTVETRRSYLTSAAVGNPGGVHVLVKYMSSPCTYTHTYTHTDTHTHTHTNTHTHTHTNTHTHTQIYTYKHTHTPKHKHRRTH